MKERWDIEGIYNFAKGSCGRKWRPRGGGDRDDGGGGRGWREHEGGESVAMDRRELLTCGGQSSDFALLCVLFL